MINQYRFGYMTCWSIIWGIDTAFDITNPVNIPKLGMVIVMWFLVEVKE